MDIISIINDINIILHVELINEVVISRVLKLFTDLYTSRGVIVCNLLHTMCRFVPTDVI